MPDHALAASGAADVAVLPWHPASKARAAYSSDPRVELRTAAPAKPTLNTCAYSV